MKKAVVLVSNFSTSRYERTIAFCFSIFLSHSFCFSSIHFSTLQQFGPENRISGTIKLNIAKYRHNDMANNVHHVYYMREKWCRLSFCWIKKFSLVDDYYSIKNQIHIRLFDLAFNIKYHWKYYLINIIEFELLYP